MKKLTLLLMLVLFTIFSNSTTTYASSNDIIGASVIHKQYNHILTMNDILSMYSSDLGAVQLAEDNYTGYGNILGLHSINLIASDGITQTSKAVDIVVVAELGNVKAVSDYKDIHLKTTQILTPSDIVYVLEKTGYIEITSTTQMVILSNTYTENSSTAGSYIFEFRLVNSAGLDMIYLSKIIVSDESNLFIPDITFDVDPSGFNVIWEYLQNIIYLIIVALVIIYGYKTYKKLNKRKSSK